jgi:beta-phosphoglucomutase-like phosphatase (HAD superfamily)
MQGFWAILPSFLAPEYTSRVFLSTDCHLFFLFQQALPICVASSGPPEKIKLALHVTNLLPRFEGRIFSSYKIGSWKPAPDLFLYAAKNMGVQPASCTVVEDSVLGVRAGVAARMKVLGYTEQSEATLLEASGARVFYSMYQLPSLLSHY